MFDALEILIIGNKRPPPLFFKIRDRDNIAWEFASV